MAAADCEEELFLAALEQTSPTAQAAFLDEACAGKPDLRRRVAVLLRAHTQPDSMLDQPAIDVGAASAAQTRTLTLSESSPAAPSSRAAVCACWYYRGGGSPAPRAAARRRPGRIGPL